MSSTARRVERRYTLFGLTIVSDLELPELFECSRTDSDVEIRLGEVPDADNSSAGVRETQDGALLRIDACARFLVSSGSRIVVEPEKNASPRNVRLFLLGSALGLLLHQRRLLPLHGNSVELGAQQAITFVGASGVGKSTLAAWFHDNGYRILADDVSVVDFDTSGLPIALPGLPRLRLWEEVMVATGRDPTAYQRSFEGDEEYLKRDVMIAQGQVVQQPLPLCAVVLLQDETSDLQIVHGSEAVDVLFSNTYRGAFVELSNTVRDHWIACTTLGITIPVFKVGLRHGLGHLSESCTNLVADLRAALVESSILPKP